MTNSPPPTAHRFIDPSQRRQRNALIGLTVGSGLVLLIGITAALLTRDDGTAVVPSTRPPAASTTLPASTTTTAVTTTAVTTTLPTPIEAVADAGPDLAATSGEVVTLSAVELTEGARDDAVTWRQTAGPDVTAGVGALGGRSVSFGAPDDVVTLEFELVVNSGDRAASAPEAVDDLVVRVFEDATRMLFVDGERGDDTADGSMEQPLRSIGAAAQRADGGEDLYVRSVGTYVETLPVRLGPGSSLYGGFDDRWARDRTQRVQLLGAAVSVIVDGDGDRRIASVDVTAADAEPGERSIGIRIVDSETVSIQDCRIVSGAGGDGTGDTEAGVSAGVVAVVTGEVRVERSTVNASDGGSGADADAPSDVVVDDGDGDVGGEADGHEPGAGASGDGPRRGGDGGRGGLDGDGNDGTGDGGGSGGTTDDADGRPGTGGAGGDGGPGGDGGQGVLDGDPRNPVGANGSRGATGEPGDGGSGGGGGHGSAAASGGGGGGGGSGADGAVGGDAGAGGAGSVGLWMIDVNRVVVSESLVAAGRGGDGGAGSRSEAAGSGGDGGAGGVGVGETVSRDGSEGGGGGGGGAGGVGGDGGGGAGGPAYGMLTAGVDEVEIRASTVRGGVGGNGANGGLGGAAGESGDAGSGRRSGSGGQPGLGERSEQGEGASGGSAFGWLDVDEARQTLEEADVVEGTDGAGGSGSSPGETDAETAANVDAQSVRFPPSPS